MPEKIQKIETKSSKFKKSRSKNSFKSRRDSFQEIAIERIDELFLQAEKVFNERKDLANRYVFLARRLSLKFKVPFKKEQKLRFCKKCNSFLVNGTNSRLRLSKGNIVVKCLSCNNIRRLKYK